MQEPDFDLPFTKIVQQGQKRPPRSPVRNMHILDICRTNPDKGFGFRYGFKSFPEQIFIRDEFQTHDASKYKPFMAEIKGTWDIILPPKSYIGIFCEYYTFG